MSVARDLLRAELRARRNAYVVLLVLFAATSGTYAVVLSLVGGLEDHIGGELSDNLAADLRVTLGAQGVADGDLITNEVDAATAIRAASPGARVAPRLEVEGLLAHAGGFTTGRFESPNTSRSAAVLVGIDVGVDASVSNVAPYLTRGVLLADAPTYETPTGERLVPVLVGERFLETSNATIAEGTFTWRAVFNLTAGRLENNQLVQDRVIAVGAYETGFRMIDRAVVYAPRGDVARLIGQHPGAPPANVLLVDAPDPTAAADAARRLGFDVMGAQEFRRTYLGPVFDTVRVVAWAIVAALTLMTAGWFAHTLSHHVRADRQKIATLRAIGIPTEAFTTLYVGLGAWLGLAGGLLGIALALAVGAALRLASATVDALGPRTFAPALAPVEALGLMALAVLAAALAALAAVRRARNVSIRDALREY